MNEMHTIQFSKLAKLQALVFVDAFFKRDHQLLNHLSCLWQHTGSSQQLNNPQTRFAGCMTVVHGLAVHHGAQWHPATSDPTPASPVLGRAC